MILKFTFGVALIMCAFIGATAQSKTADSKSEGADLYMTYCVSCHQMDGGGVPNMTPTLSKTSYVTGDKMVLISVLLNGMSNVEIDGETYHNVMPPFDYLTDKEIATILTYVRSNFGNKSKAVTESDVKTTRAAVLKK